MDLPYSLYLPVLVWLAFFCLIGLFFMFYRWAKKRKGAALAIGLFVQMMLPDPKVEHTIEWIAESKEKRSKKQTQSEDEH